MRTHPNVTHPPPGGMGVSNTFLPHPQNCAEKLPQYQGRYRVDMGGMSGHQTGALRRRQKTKKPSISMHYMSHQGLDSLTIGPPTC